MPALVISPFSHGGHIATEVFDHTSQLKLISERFGVGVPNVSAWRRATVGDLTSTLFRSAADTSVPNLPMPAVELPASGPCEAAGQYTEGVFGGAAPSVPTNQQMPEQEGTVQPHHTRKHHHKHKHHDADEARTVLAPPGPGPMTTKSSYNRLAKLSD